jgi:hypothetical protein
MNENKNVKICRLKLESDAEIGLQLSRLPWDPYPFVSSVTVNSNANEAGISVGDCLLKVTIIWQNQTKFTLKATNVYVLNVKTDMSPSTCWQTCEFRYFIRTAYI